VAATVLVWIGLILGAAVAGVVLGMLAVRGRLVRRVQKELGKDKVLLVTTSRLASLAVGRKLRFSLDAGILMLLKSGLYYHSWFSRRELYIPGPAITYIGVADGGDGHGRPRGRVILRFLTTLGQEDGVTLRLLSPDQWVSAIKTHLIGRPV
jgi:hypothetical protein